MPQQQQQAYKVVGRAHRRTMMVPETVLLPGGGTTIRQQRGADITVPVNGIITDMTADELAAFPDRFRPASPEEVQAWEKQKAQVRQAFLPVEPVAVDPKRVALEHQLVQLQQQLAAMPNPDPVAAMRERAPVDPVSSERAALEREALRQAVVEHQQQVAEAQATGKEPPALEAAAPHEGEERKEGEERQPPRRTGERTGVGGARTEERKP